MNTHKKNKFRQKLIKTKKIVRKIIKNSTICSLNRKKISKNDTTKKEKENYKYTKNL